LHCFQPLPRPTGCRPWASTPRPLSTPGGDVEYTTERAGPDTRLIESARYGGPLPVYLELPRAGSGMRRVATTFRARAAEELSREIDSAVGAGVVDVILPETRVTS